MSQRCQATTKSGEPCQAYAMRGSDYCVAHAPELAEHRREWRRKGGLRGHNKDALEEARFLQSAEEIAEFLPTVVEDLSDGNIKAKTANSIRGLCNLQLKALELTTLEERISRLEKNME